MFSLFLLRDGDIDLSAPVVSEETYKSVVAAVEVFAFSGKYDGYQVWDSERWVFEEPVFF